jgi:sterol 24-C-methyltransferase
MAGDSKFSLEREDHSRDAAFNKAMHGKSAGAKGGLVAMLGKDTDAKKAAVDEYFKHWDKTHIKDETAEDREVTSIRHVEACQSAFTCDAANKSSSFRHAELNMQP